VNARLRRPLLHATVAAVFLILHPASAADRLCQRESSRRINIAPVILPIGVDRPVIATAAYAPPSRLYSKIGAGISLAAADESCAFIVKRIALRAIGRAQTWPRRPPTAFEIPTDHIFEAGIRLTF
jgi:hypothetical protein